MMSRYSLRLFVAFSSFALTISVVEAQGTTGIIFTRGCSGVEDSEGNCIDNPTPAQRRDADERQRRQRERDEADRRERERKDAERQRQVDAVTSRIGPHRRAEAERLVRMKEAADAARGVTTRPKDTCKRRETRMLPDPNDGGKRKPIAVCLDGSRVIGQ